MFICQAQGNADNSYLSFMHLSETTQGFKGMGECDWPQLRYESILVARGQDPQPREGGRAKTWWVAKRELCSRPYLVTESHLRR